MNSTSLCDRQVARCADPDSRQAKQASVVSTPALEELPALRLGRSVVNDENLALREALGCDRGQRLFEVKSIITTRDHDADARNAHSMAPTIAPF